uniref:Uncharacterized protein n=1 Tax=Anopheles atroparvus TaxID=41427 RepID=A0A182ITE0_ANOAO
MIVLLWFYLKLHLGTTANITAPSAGACAATTTTAGSSSSSSSTGRAATTAAAAARTGRVASIIASSDQGVGLERDSSIPSRLQRPYSVPVGMPNSVLAFCTDVCPARIASKARSRSSADQVVGAALNGAARRMPSRRAILYSVEDGMPNAFEALFAEIVPVRSASRALLSESSFHVFDGPSFFGVSMPSRCARCQRVVDGIPYFRRHHHAVHRRLVLLDLHRLLLLLLLCRIGDDFLLQAGHFASNLLRLLGRRRGRRWTVVMMVMLVRVLMMLLLQVIELVLRRGTRGRSGCGQVVRFYHYDRRRRSIIVLSGEVVVEVLMCRVMVRMVRMLQVRMMVVQAVVLLLGRPVDCEEDEPLVLELLLVVLAPPPEPEVRPPPPAEEVAPDAPDAGGGGGARRPANGGEGGVEQYLPPQSSPNDNDTCLTHFPCFAFSSFRRTDVSNVLLY